MLRPPGVDQLSRDRSRWYRRVQPPAKGSDPSGVDHLSRYRLSQVLESIPVGGYNIGKSFIFRKLCRP